MAKITIENVVPVIRNGEIKKFQTSISAFGLAKMYQGDVIRYVPDIQRGEKTLKSGKIVDVFSTKHVREILEAMLSDTIHGGILTLNYAEENETELEYNERSRTLRGKGYFQILDGQHRVRAAEKWVEMWEKNPDGYPDPNGFYFPCTIEQLDNESAKGLFSEYCTTSLKISPSRASYLNVTDYSSKIAKRVMSESDLNGKVEVVSTTIKKDSNKVVTFATLTESIRKNFKPTTKAETEQVSEFLISFYDYLVQLFPEGLGGSDPHTKNEIRKTSFQNKLLAFYGYSALAKELMGKDNWKEKMNHLADIVTVNGWTGHLLDKANPIWSSVLRDEDKIINNTATQGYMAKVLVDYCVGEKSIDELTA